MTTATESMTAPRKQWSTLRLLRYARFAILLLDVVLLMAMVAATEAHRAALKTIGKDAAPSILTAQRLKAAIAGMDAQLANELLSKPENRAAAVSTYDTERAEAADALLGAAENITYGESERRPIRLLQNGLSEYEDLAERTRDLHDLERAGDSASGSALNAYRQAESMIDHSLLPAADDLEAANDSVLEKTFASENMRSTGGRFLIVFTALITLAVLLVTQMLLSQRMHRTFNPALILATLVVIVIALRTMGAVSAAHRELKVAKEDGFTSMDALWRARAAAFAAKGEGSRSLLDSAQAADHNRLSEAHTAAVAKPPADLTADELLAALREGRRIDGFSGYLAEELNNTTFPGEREAALETLSDWQAYVAQNEQVRRLERNGQHGRAVELATTAQMGGSEWAFERFDRALGRTLAISQGAFDAAVDRGFAALRGMEMQAAVATILIGILVFVGVAPRIREYQ